MDKKYLCTLGSPVGKNILYIFLKLGNLIYLYIPTASVADVGASLGILGGKKLKYILETYLTKIVSVIMSTFLYSGKKYAVDR